VSVVTVATGRLVARAQAPPGWTISADAITGASLVWAIQKQVAPGEPSPKTVVSQIRRLSLAR
jgi:hypothetical protein